MRRKVEQEGYLQDGIKSSSKLQHKPCATMDHLQTQNQFYIPVQAHIFNTFITSKIKLLYGKVFGFLIGQIQHIFRGIDI